MLATPCLHSTACLKLRSTCHVRGLRAHARLVMSRAGLRLFDQFLHSSVHAPSLPANLPLDSMQGLRFPESSLLIVVAGTGIEQ